MCGNIDVCALHRDRDQLFAEAVHRYRAGEPWWPDTAFEREHIQPQQEARFETDAWEEPIAAWLVSRDQVTVFEVAIGALGMKKSDIGTADQRRITAIMQHLRWTRGKRVGAARAWVKGQ